MLSMVTLSMHPLHTAHVLYTPPTSSTVSSMPPPPCPLWPTCILYASLVASMPHTCSLCVRGVIGALHHSTGSQSSEGIWTLASAHALCQPTTTVSEYFMLESRAGSLEVSLEGNLFCCVEPGSAFDVQSLASGD